MNVIIVNKRIIAVPKVFELWHKGQTRTSRKKLCSILLNRFLNRYRFQENYLCQAL